MNDDAPFRTILCAVCSAPVQVPNEARFWRVRTALCGNECEEIHQAQRRLEGRPPVSVVTEKDQDVW